MRVPTYLICGLFLASLSAQPLGGQAGPARVAVVLDQTMPGVRPLVDAFEKEVRGFFRPGEMILLPAQAGDGTTAGVRTVLERAMNDPSVAVVVTLGGIGSHLLARSRPTKPSIAAVVIDAAWQGIPERDDASGVPNLTYVEQSYPVGQSIADFHRLIPFKRLAVLLEAGVLDAIPQLETGAAGLVRAAGAEASIVPAKGKPAEILAAVPSDVDAVYLGPLPALSDTELRVLLAGLNARRLPTLSYLAAPDVAAGALASYEPPENWQRRARRVAVNLQRILAGENAAALPIRLVSAPRLTLNLATARQVGFAPGRSLLTDAELLGVDSAGPADTLSLAATMRLAADANLDIEAANLGVASGAQSVKLARSSLLPQVESKLSETFTREGTAAASAGQQPERMLESGVSFTLPLYNDQAWAGYTAEKRLQQAREAQRDAGRLDVVLDAATAYLNVLRSRTLVGVRRSNLSRTRSNLEIARLREDVGSASRADVYRWQGEVADARRELISAESQVRVAELDIKRLLNRPLNRPLAQEPVGLGDPAILAQDSTILAWFDDPARFVSLSQFLVTEAVRLSPELAQSDATIEAQRRQHTAAGRAFWLPSVALQGGFSNVLDRGGAGSTLPTSPAAIPSAPDLTWQFRLQVSLPLFSLERSATRAQTSLELERLQVQRRAVEQGVDQRVRSALETAAASLFSDRAHPGRGRGGRPELRAGERFVCPRCGVDHHAARRADRGPQFG